MLTNGLAPAAAQVAADPTIYRGWDLSGFEVGGVPGGLGHELADGLALAQKTGGFLAKSRPAFDPKLLEEDLKRARLFLARRGYPAATVTPSFEPDTERRAVRLRFDVELGAAVVVRGTRTEAMPPTLEPLAERVLRLDDGEVFSDWAVDRRVGELLRVLQDHGFARAEVRAEVVGPDSVSAVVVFHVAAGRVFRFGKTIVKGAPDDLREVVRRTADIGEGDVYSLEELERAEESLRLLDLFRRMRVRTEARGDDVLDVVADVETAPPRTIDLGVGYWTTDKVRVEAAWRHRNLLHAGRGVGVDGAYSQYAQSVGVQLWKPVLFHSRTRGSISLRGRRESEDSYELRAGDLELGATYLATIQTSWGATLGLSVFELDEKIDEARQEDPGPNLVSLSLQWTHDTIDDHLSPTSGTLSRVELETGLPSFDTTQRYGLLSPQVSGFLPGPGATVFAARVSAGYALRATDASHLLANKRYYAGGSGSMRGYERRDLGPSDSQGRPSGGVAKLELSGEIRVPLFWRFSGAAWVDAANVWPNRSAIRLDDLEVASGPGLLVTTPVGPVRLDVGFPVTAKPLGQPRVVYLLSVGQVF